MALAARTWKYVGSAVPAANTAAGILNAIYTLCISGTYYNGAARTPGSGVAVTGVQHQVGGVTECVDIAPVAQTHGIRYLLAGSASARTPTMVTSPNTDTWQTATLMLGMARNWNTYNVTGNGWDQALPGSAGSLFTGYVRAFACASLTCTRVHLFECADGIIIALAQSGGCTMLGCGLDIDTRVTYATSPNCAENTTGGRYLMWNTSSSQAIITTFHSASFSPILPYGQSGANLAHCYMLSVGGVSLTAVWRNSTLINGTDTTSFINDDGDWIPLEIEFAASTNNKSIGRLREVRAGPDRKIGDTFSSSGTVRGYAVSSHPTVDNDTLWLIA